MKKDFSKNGKSVFSIITITLVIILLAVLFLFGSVSAKFEDDSLILNATFTTQAKILFDEIESVELKENFNVGLRAFGIDAGKLLAGNFNNNECGSYKLFSYANVKKHIVIKTAKGYFVYNLKSESLTENSYNDLLAKLSNAK